MKALNRFNPRIEGLENRSLLSVTLTNGLLEVVGTTGNDNIRLVMSSPTELHVTNTATGDDQTFDLASVTGILVCSRAGDDRVVIGPNIMIPAEVRGWTGNDTILGGGGNDTVLGGGGNDYIQGRGGNDKIFGQAGDDYLVDYEGTNRLNGGDGNDLLNVFHGANTVLSGTDINFDFMTTDLGGPGFARLFTSSEITGNHISWSVKGFANGVPNTSGEVYFGGVLVGRLTTDASGNGLFNHTVNYDMNNDGLPDFLNGTANPFPEITPDMVISIHIISPSEKTFSATVRQLEATKQLFAVPLPPMEFPPIVPLS